jgi:hypothetical protein
MQQGCKSLVTDWKNVIDQRVPLRKIRRMAKQVATSAPGGRAARICSPLGLKAVTAAVRRHLEERREARQWCYLYEQVMATRDQPKPGDPIEGLTAEDLEGILLASRRLPASH